MVIYSAFYLPVIFVLLFQLNLDAWVKMRINYEVSFAATACELTPSLLWSSRAPVSITDASTRSQRFCS